MTDPFLHHKDVLTKCFRTVRKGVSPYHHIHTDSAAYPLVYSIGIVEISVAVCRKKGKTELIFTVEWLRFDRTIDCSLLDGATTFCYKQPLFRGGT